MVVEEDRRRQQDMTTDVIKIVWGKKILCKIVNKALFLEVGSTNFIQQSIVIR